MRVNSKSSQYDNIPLSPSTHPRILSIRTQERSSVLESSQIFWHVNCLVTWGISQVVYLGDCTYGLHGVRQYKCIDNADTLAHREDGLASPAPNYGLDWYEGAIVRPDQVLLDFAQAVNPTSFPVSTLFLYSFPQNCN